MKSRCSRALFVYLVFLSLILLHIPGVMAADTPNKIKRAQPINVGVGREADVEIPYEVMMNVSVKMASKGSEEVPYELCWSVSIKTDVGLHITPTIQYPNGTILMLSAQGSYVRAAPNIWVTSYFYHTVEIDLSTTNETMFVCSVDIRR